MDIWRRLAAYDLYERHTVVNRLLHVSLPGEPEESTVLDVGGRRGLLSAYTSYAVTAVNPDETGDLVNDGAMLSFADNAFAAVVTLDTLEHLPKEVRGAFLTECLRVASDVLLVAAPLGTPAHIQCEEALNARFFAINGCYHEYLNEHVKFGLPTLEELNAYCHSLPNRGTALYFAGDFVWQANIFERSFSTAYLPRLLTLPYNLLHRLMATALFHPIDLRIQAHATTNRFYLVLNKR